MSTITLLASFSALIVFGSLCAGATKCEDLASVRLPDTSITAVETIAAHAYHPATPFPAPGPRGALKVLAADELPTFCRVAATVRPSPDSNIKFELWLPILGWNGNFMGIGNGGWAGSITYQSMGEPLSRGYATASTDTGHEGVATDASFALGHPEKIIDFGYRAVHEMTVKAKAIATAYYGRAPRYSYWNGCSTGGRQGLKEAQQYPGDYDGIVAGAPANFFTHLSAQYIWAGQAIHRDPAGIIPRTKLPIIHNAVLTACDALDGVKDGVLEDPRRCTFDPRTIECRAGDDAQCLSPAQVEVAERLYSASSNPRTKETVYPGLMQGSELGWIGGVGHLASEPPPLATGIFKFVTLQDPQWNYASFDFDADMDRVDQKDHGVINAIDPNLGAFFRRGGKLLQYHGWTDPGISPVNSINYYKKVSEATKGSSAINGSYRLFMMPGMDHCGGGDGPNSFDSIRVIEQWVENHSAPDKIIASHTGNGKSDRTRPLCVYPQVAVYKGSGNTNDATTFSCVGR